MTHTDRPNLSLGVLFQIETAQNQIHIHYRAQLERIQVPTEKAQEERLKLYPIIKYQPPMLKSPHSLRVMLTQYSTSLFESEATLYPSDPQLRSWLGKLAGRIQSAVIETIVKLEQVGKAKKITLMYHGVTYLEMRETIATNLAKDIDLHIKGRIVTGSIANIPATTVMRRPQAEIDAEQKIYNETARHLMGEPEREETRDAQALNQSKTSARVRFVEPLLLEKGWSRFQWALEAEVAYNTGADYLAGKTNPHPKTRVKLSKALGIQVNQLPK